MAPLPIYQGMGSKALARPPCPSEVAREQMRKLSELDFHPLMACAKQVASYVLWMTPWGRAALSRPTRRRVRRPQRHSGLEL